MSVWGRVQAFLTGAAVSRASSDAVGPVMEPVRQRSNQRNAVRVLDPGTIAELIAQLILDTDEGNAEALRSGVNPNRLQALTLLAQAVPGIGEARTLRRRQKGADRQITLDQVHHVYAKNQIESQYWDALDALIFDILSPGEIAAAIHRGLIPDPDNLLLGQQPEPPFNVEAYPVYDSINALAEAMGHGYDRDRLGVLVGLQGLPMGVIEAAHAYWRGILTKGDYIRAFNESNNRNEWAEAVLEYSRQIPTARDFFENALRGHHTFEWAAEQAARHGMSATDSEIIYQNQGRPLNLHQITQALAWGAKYNPASTDDPDPWMQAVLLGPVRPEYYDMQHTLKYTLPSAFYFRSLQEQNVLNEADAAMWYKRLGWPPELADLVAKAYAKPTTTAAKENPYVSKADNQLWTALHKAYVKTGAARAAVEPILGHLIPVDTVREAVFADWDLEREAQALAPATP